MTWRPEPKPKMTGADLLRITGSMLVACVLGALVLGVVYVGTARYSEAARVAGEQRAVSDMLGLAPGTRVRVVTQFLAPRERQVVYREASADGASARELVYTLDGALVRRGAPVSGEDDGWMPLGRLFVAYDGDRPTGFVVEGETRGYKNTIRFFVALDSAFTIQGVRVIEHEEDPGLGAETATTWFTGQFIGRRADQLGGLDVTRDPMPEDWRLALASLDRTPRGVWREQQSALMARESERPIYAVTGATISSRAVTDGVRTTVDHFRRRWALIGPDLGGAS
ncbi:MAG TPA: FMN-binding protein [Dongiaceae bacterium]|nr:FMN-binding protein [Dongiaceae bacterium]